jgi:hypothetical protein
MKRTILFGFLIAFVIAIIVSLAWSPPSQATFSKTYPKTGGGMDTAVLAESLLYYLPLADFKDSSDAHFALRHSLVWGDTLCLGVDGRWYWKSSNVIATEDTVLINGTLRLKNPLEFTTANLFEVAVDWGLDTTGTAQHAFQLFRYADHTYSASVATTPPLGWASKYWYLVSTSAEATTDSCSLIDNCVAGSNIPLKPDSLRFKAAFSDTDSTSIRVLVYKSDNTIVLNTLLSGFILDDEKWRSYAVPFTANLTANDAVTVRFDITCKGKNWVKVSKAWVQ